MLILPSQIELLILECFLLSFVFLLFFFKILPSEDCFTFPFPIVTCDTSSSLLSPTCTPLRTLLASLDSTKALAQQIHSLHPSLSDIVKCCLHNLNSPKHPTLLESLKHIEVYVILLVCSSNNQNLNNFTFGVSQALNIHYEKSVLQIQ